jgi:hypothetical protein
MSQESIPELVKSIIALGPTWAAILLAVGILCWRSDKIVKELFAGVKGILLAIRQTEKPKITDKKNKPGQIEGTPQKAVSD